MPGIWEEVKTRKIFKAATFYAAIAWGIIQIADILLPVLGIADWVMSSMVLMAFAGFPVALIAGWMLDIRIERKRVASVERGDADGEFTAANYRARFAELAVITLFGIGAAFLYYNSASEPAQASIAEPGNLQKMIAPQKDQKTIAVLPFANFSDSNEDEFFADGLSEELLNVLARNKKLRVAARTSSFQYKKTNINIKTIAHELGVQYVLEGSVRRSGDLIRVTAQLIKADEDVHVFSKSWDRTTSNVFKVQDEIAQSVLNELKVSLLGETEPETSEIGTQNIAAFAEYSRGLAFLRNRGKTDFENAIKDFEKALEIDPNYAEAMAMLAEVHLLKVSYGYIKKDEGVEKAKPLVEKALQLNPKLGAAHAVKGLMYWQMANSKKKEGKKEELEIAKVHLLRAIDINPSIAEAYMWYGSILQEEGNFSDGAKLRKKAYEIDPRAAVVGYNRAKDLVRYGDYKDAMDVFNTVVRNNPNYPAAYSIAGEVSYNVGQLDQAYSMYSRFAQLGDNEMSWLINSSRIFIPLGEFQLAQQNIDQLKKLEMGKHDFGNKFDWLQAFIWIASDDMPAYYNWVESFEESTQDWGQRLWRGLALMKQEKWKLALEDLAESLALARAKNPERVDEDTIRIQLFLARTYKALGNQLKSEHYLSVVDSEVQQLKAEGFDSQSIRYLQSALAALKGEQRNALALLRQSVQEGFVDFWWADADPSFDTARQDPMFSTIKSEFKIRMKLMQNNIESQYGKLVMNQPTSESGN
ncbi:tetratricopeptide repeat protein [Aliikangiella coralliicola]|uniref:Tetratricopeptide repeat protein n=1 Tax=Aliikangiella coralliicola TaxID=2592383 RepID=A0A545TW87_9GAMM|nr:tetratricopeptide repeat protein [Aliikangiella coralliicola]TQV81464.1 tetratricopeptide repeat protein [Aliikangiella coralliicola]